MKKILIFTMSILLMTFFSCSNFNKSENNDEDTLSVITDTFAQEQITEKIQVEIDSIANEYSKLKPVEGIFTNGKFVLSENELRNKPDYLTDPSLYDDLNTNNQKYCAIGMLIVDKKVASIYDMDTIKYTNEITKLITEVNDPMLQDPNSLNDISKLYEYEKNNNRVSLFWETCAGVIVENLYIISQNPDKFIKAFDDNSANNITLHINILMDAINRLKAYDKNINKLYYTLEPINKINAISVKQLEEQIIELTPTIDNMRIDIFN